MGRAKDELIDRQHARGVAGALRISPDALDGYEYEIVEDSDRAGNVTRTFIRWTDEVPEGVETDLEGLNETTIVLPEGASEND